uniref:Uncharacterized protein n=1 Tax=viral metagenome TaxID=1070528 RepID=A0A6C0ICB2_9ZZZZ
MAQAGGGSPQKCFNLKKKLKAAGSLKPGTL